MVIDFDDFQTWGPHFGAAVEAIAPSGTLDVLRASKPEYLEDAATLVKIAVGWRELVDQVNDAFVGSSVRLYHGTRLTDGALKSVRDVGLRPLDLEARREELETIFGQHRQWGSVAGRMDEVLQKIGREDYAGRRVDRRVHVCFSRAGLLQGCSHYLHFGGEVDGHVAHLLFGDSSAHSLLVAARQPKLVTFVRSFPDAVAAANPYGLPTHELPSLIRLLLTAWAYSQVDSKFSPSSLNDSTAAWFEGGIPDIEAILDVDEASLGPP